MLKSLSETLIFRVSLGESVLARLITIATSSTATGTRFAGFGFIDSQRATVKFLTVESGDRCLGFFIRAHGDKAKTAGASSFPVGDEGRFRDIAVRTEGVVEF